MTYSPQTTACWQSEVIRDTFRLSNGQPISGGFYELSFNANTPNNVELRVAANSDIDSHDLTTFLARGHVKAGYQSISNCCYLAPVASVKVISSTNDEIYKTFKITLRPTYQPDRPALETFSNEIYTMLPNNNKEKKD